LRESRKRLLSLMKGKKAETDCQEIHKPRLIISKKKKKRCGDRMGLGGEKGTGDKVGGETLGKQVANARHWPKGVWGNKSRAGVLGSETDTLISGGEGGKGKEHRKEEKKNNG